MKGNPRRRCIAALQGFVMAERISIYDVPGLDRLRHERHLDAKCVRRLRNDLLKRFLTDEVALAKFPAADRITAHVLNLHRRVDSALDGATKLLLSTSSGMLIESVILRTKTG